MTLEVGSEAPSFCAKDTYGEQHCLDDYNGKWVVLYFYPKDNTPGCTVEAIDFTARKAEFATMDAEIIGRTATDTKVRVVVKAREAGVSHVAIRAGLFGDEVMSRKVYDEIRTRLRDAKGPHPDKTG